MLRQPFLVRLALAAPLLVLVTSCGSGGDSAESEPEETQLQSAFDECLPEIEDGLVQFEEDAPPVEDIVAVDGEGTSIVVTTPEPVGEITSAIALGAAECVLEETDAPASIGANMRSTTALMGRQDADYNGITVQWSYAAGIDANGYQATFDETSSE